MLANHLRRHRRKKSWVCSVCKNPFSTKYILDSHMIRHDPKLAKYTCDKCSEGFAMKSRYLEHLKQHNTFYKCSVPGCNKSLSSKRNLTNHINKCGNGEKFPCGGCNKNFSSIESLRQHERKIHLPKTLDQTKSSVDTIMSNDTGYSSDTKYSSGTVSKLE